MSHTHYRLEASRLYTTPLPPPELPRVGSFFSYTCLAFPQKNVFKGNLVLFGVIQVKKFKILIYQHAHIRDGGVSFLFNKSMSSHITWVEMSSKRVCCIRLNTMCICLMYICRMTQVLVNIYLNT